jgi:hypothetical protein
MFFNRRRPQLFGNEKQPQFCWKWETTSIFGKLEITSIGFFKLRNVIQAFPVLLTFSFKTSQKSPALVLLTRAMTPTVCRFVFQLTTTFTMRRLHFVCFRFGLRGCQNRIIHHYRADVILYAVLTAHLYFLFCISLCVHIDILRARMVFFGFLFVVGNPLNVFCLQAEQFCILCVHIDSCCNSLNCSTVHSRLLDWFTLPCGAHIMLGTLVLLYGVCPTFSSLCTLVHGHPCRWLILDKPAGDLRVDLSSKPITGCQFFCRTECNFIYIDLFIPFEFQAQWINDPCFC